jgi:hypothetical protein
VPLRVSGWQEGQRHRRWGDRHVRCHVRVVVRPSRSSASREAQRVSSIARPVNLAGQLSAPRRARCHVRAVVRPSRSSASRKARHVSSIAQPATLAGQRSAPRRVRCHVLVKGAQEHGCSSVHREEQHATVIAENASLAGQLRSTPRASVATGLGWFSRRNWSENLIN